MKISRRGFMVAAGAGAACTAWGCAHTPRSPEQVADTQPLWLVSTGASKVYIYGNGGSATPKWSSPRVEAAFAEADVFWKETADPKAGDQQKFIVPGLGGARPLSTWLSAEQKAIVEAAALEAETTYQALEPLKPWLAAFSINQAYNKHRSQAPVDDPIPILTARAMAQGKPVHSEIPDADSQLELLTGMSAAAQVEYLLYTIENNRLPQDVVDRRRRAWADGDLCPETRQVEHFKADYPNLYEPFELQRNRAWPARIQQMLIESKAAFVLVGADHMVGPDSIPVQLGRVGLDAKRV